LQGPLALYEKRDNAMRLAATDRAARAAGLHEGQSLSDARAICPGVVAREIDHGFLTMMFARLADWHANVSPIVAVMKTDRPYGDLMLDITGVAPLFGGERALLDRVVARLAEFGYTAQGAIGPSIGSAWALSHFAPGTIAEEGEGRSLSPLRGGQPPHPALRATFSHKGRREDRANSTVFPSPLMGDLGAIRSRSSGTRSAIKARRAGEGGTTGAEISYAIQFPEGEEDRQHRFRLVTKPSSLPSPPLGHPRDQGSGRVFDAIAAAQEKAVSAIAGTAGSDIATLLAPLPVMALRLDAEEVMALRQMGLKRIGQLYGRERRGLLARFGDTPLLRLDQALGVADEKLVPRLPVPERYVDRKFAEPIGLIDDVLLCVTDLSHRLSGQLQGEGAGAQTFHLLLFRVDHQVMHLPVNAARATRDASHIARLFANRIERLVGDFDAGFGIEMMRLMASSVSDLAEIHATSFLGGGEADALDRLYDRMASRLGAAAVLRLKPLNSHIPERATELEPVVGRSKDRPEAAEPVGAPRPIRLLPRPEPVKVIAEVPDGPPARMVWRRIGYRFLKAAGPERIGVEWWNPGEGALTRDYYSCEDDEGRRFWLFREGLYDETDTPRWFLHGLFG
jgi:protein ImuB